MSSYSLDHRHLDEVSSSDRCQDGDDCDMEVTITVISLDGLTAKNYHPKSKLPRMHRKSHHQDAATSVVSSISQDLSTEKTFFTHVPSLPLHLDKSFLSQNQSSHPVIQWPRTDAAEAVCADKHELLSTVRIQRRFQREGIVESNNASSMHRLKPQTCPINISISRHGKLINLGKVSVIVNGEETGTSSINIPITSTYQKPKMKVGLKSNKGTAMARVKGDIVEFGLKSDAMLRVLVSVAAVDAVEDAASDPFGIYDDDVDVDCESVVESGSDDDYEVGDTILIENSEESEGEVLRRELSESKYIIQNLTNVLTLALEMSQEEKGEQDLDQIVAANHSLDVLEPEQVKNALVPLSGYLATVPSSQRSCCSLPTVEEEEEEEHTYCEEGQMMDKYGSVVNDEERREEHIKLIVDKSNEADELKWKNILDKVAPLIANDSYRNVQDKVKHHTRKGLPDSMRQRAWIVLTGVDVIMSQRKGVYQSMLNKANSICKESGLTPGGKHSSRTVLNQINKDTERTSLKHFSSNQDFSHDALRRVLRAYSQLDPEVGYCQGMNYITAMFLTFLSEEEAFWVLVVVMNQEPYNVRELFLEDMSGTHEMLYIAEKLMKQFFPKLSKHLHKEEVRSSMFVTQWLMTLFTSSFPFDLVARVWDSFLVEGWKVVYRTLLGLLKHAEGTLLHLSFEHILHYLSNFPGNVNGQTIMQEALKIGLKTKHIQKHANDWKRSTGNLSSVTSPPKKISYRDAETISTCSLNTI